MKKLICAVLVFQFLSVSVFPETLIYTIRSGSGAPREKSVTLTPGTTLRVSGSGTLDVVTDEGLATALGLGTASGEDVGFFATAAQGGLADSALQPGETRADLSGGSGTLDLSIYTLTLPADVTRLGSTIDLSGGEVTGTLPGSAMQNSGTANAGAVTMATDAEIQTGTDTAKVVRVSGLAAFWSWLKTQAQTISGNWTFSGTTTMTGNVAIGDAAGDTLVISGSSITAANATGTGSTAVANVGTLDARYMQTLSWASASWRVHPNDYTPSSTLTGSGSSSRSNNDFWRASTGTTAGSTAEIKLLGGNYSPYRFGGNGSPGSGASGIRMDKPMVFSVRFRVASSSANTTARILFLMARSQNALAATSYIYGVNVANLTVTPLIGSGSATGSIAVTAGNVNTLQIRSNASTVEWWLNGTQFASVANPYSTRSGQENTEIGVGIANNADANDSAINILAPITIMSLDGN